MQAVCTMALPGRVHVDDKDKYQLPTADTCLEATQTCSPPQTSCCLVIVGNRPPQLQPDHLGHSLATLWSSAPLLTDTADDRPKASELAALQEKWTHWERAWKTPRPDHNAGMLEPGLLQTHCACGTMEGRDC